MTFLSLKEDSRLEKRMYISEALNGNIGLPLKDRKMSSCYCSMIGQSYMDNTVFTLRSPPHVVTINLFT